MIAAKHANQFMLRLPDGLRERVQARAAANGRSMNTEIVAAIERHLTKANQFDDLAARVDAIERQLRRTKE